MPAKQSVVQALCANGRWETDIPVEGQCSPGEPPRGDLD